VLTAWKAEPMIQALVAALFVAAAPGAPPDAAAPPPPKAAGQGATVSEAVVTAKSKDDPMKIVCRNELPVGSRLPVKRCETKGDAEMRKFEDRQQLERMQGDTYRR
jgi:hypothetical protein